MSGRRRVGFALLLGAVALVTVAVTGAGAAPTGQMTWAVHFTLAPRWFDPGENEGSIHQIQRVLHERRVFAPVWENGFIRGVGPRVEEPALALIPSFPYSAPYEDVRLKP